MNIKNLSELSKTVTVNKFEISSFISYVIVFRALALLEHPLILQQNQQFKTQFKQHFLFSVQYLVREVGRNKYLLSIK